MWGTILLGHEKVKLLEEKLLAKSDELEKEGVEKIVRPVVGNTNKDKPVMRNVVDLEENVGMITTLLKRYSEIKADASEVKGLEEKMTNRARTGTSKELSLLMGKESSKERGTLELVNMREATLSLRCEVSKLREDVSRVLREGGGGAKEMGHGLAKDMEARVKVFITTSEEMLIETFQHVLPLIFGKVSQGTLVMATAGGNHLCFQASNQNRVGAQMTMGWESRSDWKSRWTMW